MFGSSMKRSGDFQEEKDHDNHGPLKRRRLDYTPTAQKGSGGDDKSNDDKLLESFSSTYSSQCDPRKPPNFLDFHFKVLRSLYEPKQQQQPLSPRFTSTPLTRTAANDDNQDDDDDDTPIPESTWSMIEKFLHERREILQAKQRQNTWLAIHGQALQHQQVGTATTTTTESLSSPAAARRPPPALAYPASQQQPQHQPLAAGAFPMVARLIGMHAATVRQQFQQQVVDVYQPLEVVIGQRIECLLEHLKHLQQTMEERDQKQMGDWMSTVYYNSTPWSSTRRSSHAAADGEAKTKSPSVAEVLCAREKDASQLLALKTKIRLWSLLAADLKGCLLKV